jgi:hypothetical protein
MNKSIFKMLGLACVLLFATSSNATIITLDELPGGSFRYQSLPIYTEAGFEISVSCTNCINVISTLNESANYANRTGAIGWGANSRFLETWNSQAIFILSATSGQNFDFLGMDMGWYNNSTSNASWEITSLDSANNQINQVDVIGKGNFAFNMTGVNSIQFRNLSGFSSFDNLVVSEVPEPSTIAIFALGLIGFASRRFKNPS